MQRSSLFACIVTLMLAANLSAVPVRPAPMSGADLERSARSVVMETSLGRIVIELFPEKAPITVKNFLKYVDDGYYDGTIFHRLISDFMIQGGGFLPNFKDKPGRAPIINEAGNGVSNERGTLAAARTSEPNSATSQFFINTKDNKFLDRAASQDKVGYAVFGRVAEGMDVVDRIRQVATGNRGGHNDVPVQNVTILSVRRLAK